MFSLTNIGHAVFYAGLVITVCATALGLFGGRLYGASAGPVRRRRRILQMAMPILVLALAAGGMVAVSRSSLAEGHQGVDAASGSPSAAGHSHANADQLAELQPDKPLPPETRAKLAEQLVAARAVAARFPTVEDAQRAGMVLAGGFAPGVGAHYIWFEGVAGGIAPGGEVDPSRPAAFIYDGTSPGSRLTGLMYLSLGSTVPAGFAGPNDHWHRHFNLCTKFSNGRSEVPVPADRDITRAMCDSVGGAFAESTTWMVHAWVVPGWESPRGVFSHDNPNLRCADGSTKTDARGFCRGT
jgi:hypothetical protein